MEANLVLGMTTNSSYFSRACSIDLGIAYDKVIKLIIGQGISRVSNSSPTTSKGQLSL